MKTIDKLTDLNSTLLFIQEQGYLSSLKIERIDNSGLYYFVKVINGKSELAHHKDTYGYYDMNSFLRGYYYAKLNLM